MGRRYIHIFCGAGMGKTSAALGKGVRAASEGKSVVVIQFLKEKKTENVEEFFKRLEPEIRLFRFEKFPEEYESLTEREREEENLNIKNGLNFARKVLVTGECDVLILDEILGILDEGVISGEELCAIIAQARNAQIQLILTGTIYPDCLNGHVDEVTRIQTRYE